MISNFSEEAQNILIKAKLEMLDLKHPYIGTEHLLLAILNNNLDITRKLEDYDLTYEKFKQEIINVIGKGTKQSEFFLHTPLLKKVIENAVIDSKDNNSGIVTPEHLFFAILEVGEGIAIRTLIGMNIDLDELYDEFSQKVYERKKKEKKLLTDELGTNLNTCAKEDKLDPLYGREKEIERIEEILCRKNKNNPLLIGPPGSGKTAIIEGLATLIENKKVPPKLIDKQIISIDLASCVAGTKYRGEFEERMKKILNEIENNENIILFIDEIHTLIGAGGAEGAIDASNILKPALARGKIKLIGATTTEEYKKHFGNDLALERRFQTITIEEPSINETKTILHNLKPIYENYHHVTIKDEIIDEIITLSERYLTGKFRPDKEIDILDEVCSKVNISKQKNSNDEYCKLVKLRNKKDTYIKSNDTKKIYEYKIKETNILNKLKEINILKEVTIEDVATIISNKTKIPISTILNKNKIVLNYLNKDLKQQIFGQDEAIQKIIKALKQKILNNNLPTSILLYGPHGTGKSKTASIIAKALSKDATITIDMNNYRDNQAITRLIGVSAGLIGYDDNKYLFNVINDNPNMTIILDHIEKAEKKIIDLINEIITTGHIKDAKNKDITFKNTNIIMITTKGNNNSIGFHKSKIDYNLNEYFEENFLNNITSNIEFKFLNKETITRIIKLELYRLKDKYKKEINVNNNLIDKLIKESNYQSQGANNVSKLINNLENSIIDSLFSK